MPMSVGRLKSATVYAAPILLVLVAVSHAYLVLQHDLSPWKGGGFGMFSTVDKHEARWFRVYLQTDVGSVVPEFPLAFDSRKALLRRGKELGALPTRTALDEFAHELARGESRWVHCRPTGVAGAPFEDWRTDDYAVFSLPFALTENCRPLNVSAVGVEIWRHRYERETRSLVGERLIRTVAEAE